MIELGGELWKGRRVYFNAEEMRKNGFNVERDDSVYYDLQEKKAFTQNHSEQVDDFIGYVEYFAGQRP